MTDFDEYSRLIRNKMIDAQARGGDDPLFNVYTSARPEADDGCMTVDKLLRHLRDLRSSVCPPTILVSCLLSNGAVKDGKEIHGIKINDSLSNGGTLLVLSVKAAIETHNRNPLVLVRKENKYSAEYRFATMFDEVVKSIKFPPFED